MVANHYSIGVRIDTVDVAPVVIEGGTIEYGRSDRTDQPSPTICELSLFTKQGWPQNPNAWFEYGIEGGEWATGASGFIPTHDTDDTYYGPKAGIYIGAPVWVAISTTSGFAPDHDTQDTYLGEEFRRFTGVVQSIDYSRERLLVTAVSTIEQWTRVGLFDFPEEVWETERDTYRAERICEAVPSPTILHTEGTPGLHVAEAIESDFPTSLYNYLAEMASETGALFYQDREGRVWWRSRNWVYLGAYPIPPEIVDAESLDMALELGQVENWVRLTWRTINTADPLNPVVETPAITVEDQTLIDRYGYRFGTYSTKLGDYVGAYAAAMTILDALSPRWEMPDATVLLNLANDQQLREICELDLGSLVEITPMPTGAPMETVTAEILGYTEHLAETDWAIDFHLAPHISPYPEQGPG